VIAPVPPPAVRRHRLHARPGGGGPCWMLYPSRSRSSGVPCRSAGVAVRPAWVAVARIVHEGPTCPST
jgi:hypothetical protein